MTLFLLTKQFIWKNTVIQQTHSDSNEKQIKWFDCVFIVKYLSYGSVKSGFDHLVKKVKYT